MFSDVKICKETFGLLEQFCDEFLIHAADVEGKQSGIDRELVSLLAECTQTPLTYAGGVRTTGDLELIDTISRGKIDVTIGSALDIFGGALKYRDVVEFCNKKTAI